MWLWVQRLVLPPAPLQLVLGHGVISVYAIVVSVTVVFWTREAFARKRSRRAAEESWEGRPTSPGPCAATTAHLRTCLLRQNSWTMGSGYDDQRSSWVKLSVGRLQGARYQLSPSIKVVHQKSSVSQKWERAHRGTQGTHEGSWQSRGSQTENSQRGSLFEKWKKLARDKRKNNCGIIYIMIYTKFQLRNKNAQLVYRAGELRK